MPLEDHTLWISTQSDNKLLQQWQICKIHYLKSLCPYLFSLVSHEETCPFVPYQVWKGSLKTIMWKWTCEESKTIGRYASVHRVALVVARQRHATKLRLLLRSNTWLAFQRLPLPPKGIMGFFWRKFVEKYMLRVSSVVSVRKFRGCVHRASLKF